MQDTPSLRKEYEVKHKGQGSPGYPQALLETIIEPGTGQIHRFKLSNRHVSELALFYELLDELSPNSLLLLDTLYNCYEIISQCNRKGLQWVLPAKKEESVVGENHKLRLKRGAMETELRKGKSSSLNHRAIALPYP